MDSASLRHALGAARFGYYASSCARLPASPGYGFAKASTPRPATSERRVYDWFTEGFDTADLKNAAALLDELA